MLGKQLQTAAAGSGAAEGLGIEDVFSTYLTVGAGGQTITNGIDLSTEGGMVWSKVRAYGVPFAVHDTERGTNKFLSTNSTAAQIDVSSNTSFHSITSFNTDGFTTGNDGGYGYTDLNGYGNYVHWTFRKAPGFFDVVTYAGDGASNRQISHNLGSTPGMIIVKNTTSSTFGWYVWHRSLSSNQEMQLNTTAAATSNGSFTAVTSTYFSPINNAALNGSGSNYVAYFFAHDDAIFGESADQSVIKCGGYSGNGSSQEINLGFEPQWLLVKVASGEVDDWYIFDSMRGWNVLNNNQPTLRPNQSYAESGSHVVNPTSTGFKLPSLDLNKSGKTYIYIAIRRGPMKTPTDATTLFNTVASTTGPPWWKPGFPVDWGIGFSRTTTDKFFTGTRLLGTENLNTTQTAAASTNTNNTFDYQNGWYANITAVPDYMSWNFRRAPGFFDVVAYTGTGDGLSSQTVSHNLTVAPELIIHKTRSNAFAWWCWHQGLGGADKYLFLNTSDAVGSGASVWGNTLPTATQFTVGVGLALSPRTYVAYLFATCPGVSKVGSYTGTATTLNVDCGFSAGARFVLIKRTDSTGDWYVWDTARGIVSGNDPYLLLNSTAAEVTTTDYIDPYSAGFTVTSSAPAALNASGGTYLFLAIA